MNAPTTTQEVAPYLAQEAPAMPLAPKTQFSLAPRDLEQAIQFAELLSKANMVTPAAKAALMALTFLTVLP